MSLVYIHKAILSFGGLGMELDNSIVFLDFLARIVVLDPNGHAGGLGAHIGGLL